MGGAIAYCGLICAAVGCDTRQSVVVCEVLPLYGKAGPIQQSLTSFQRSVLYKDKRVVAQGACWSAAAVSDGKVSSDSGGGLPIGKIYRPMKTVFLCVGWPQLRRMFGHMVSWQCLTLSTAPKNRG